MLKVFTSFPVYVKALVVILVLLGFYSFFYVLGVFFDENSDAVPANGGMYTEGSVGSIHAINPVLPYYSDAERDLNQLIFSGLMKHDTKTGEIVPDLAVCEVSGNATVYTCNIKSDVRWSDGKALTIDDVMFTYGDVIKNENFTANPALKLIFENVEVDKISENAVEFKLPEGDSFFMSNLTQGILPKHLLGLLPAENLTLSDFNLKPVGSGPYELDNLAKNENVWTANLSRNENYYGEKPYIDSLILHFYPSFTDLFSSLGIFNAVKSIPTDQLENVEGQDRFRVYQYTLPQYVALFLDTQKGATADPKVRYGLLLATDKVKITDMADGKKVDTPFLDNPEEFDIEFNPERAGGAFFDAGYSLDQEKNLRYKTEETPEGPKKITLRLKLLTSADNHMYSALADEIASQWENVGVEVDLVKLSGEDFNQAILDRDYDVLLFGQNFGQNPDMTPFWHSKNALTGLNFSDYRNYATDVLLESAKADTNPETRENTFRKIAKFVASPIYDGKQDLIGGTAGIFLYTPNFHIGIDDKVKGVEIGEYDYSADRFSDLLSWYIREEKTLQSDMSLGKIWSWFQENL